MTSLFLSNKKQKGKKMEETAINVWDNIHKILEAMGVIFIPFVGWVMMTILNHGQQIIRLEEKVNDSLNRRMTSLEERVMGMEERLESKIDTIERNVIECKLTINEKAGALSKVVDKIDELIKKMDE
jgi:predicted PurR-regulated permease PerM